LFLVDSAKEKNSLVSNFFLSLNLWHIKKQKKKERRRKSHSKRHLFASIAKKLSKGKLDRINSELAQI
jgi:hypothetical protein